MADWFNNDLSDYIDKKEKVVIDVRKNDKNLCFFQFYFVVVFFSNMWFLGSLRRYRFCIIYIDR